MVRGGGHQSHYENPGTFTNFPLQWKKKQQSTFLGGEQQWLMEENLRVWQCIVGSKGEELEREEKNQ